MLNNIHPAASEQIGILSDELCQLVRLLVFTDRPDRKTKKPISTTITGSDILGHPVFRRRDVEGDFCISFYHNDSGVYGLKGIGTEKLFSLIDSLYKLKQINSVCSEIYIESKVIEWLRGKNYENVNSSLIEYISKNLSEDIKTYTILVPFDGIETEVDFRYGNFGLTGISQEHFAKWFKSHESRNDDTAHELMLKMKTDMQGCASYEATINATAEFSQLLGTMQAESFCDMLRLYAPSRSSLLTGSSLGLLGTTVNPVTHCIAESNKGGFNYLVKSIEQQKDYWVLTEEYLSRMRKDGFDFMIKIYSNPEASDFVRHCWKSMVAFSRSMKPLSVEERLSYRVSAVESLLVRNSSESLTQNVADRMAFLISDIPSKRLEIAENYKSVYRMRSDFVHHRNTVKESEAIEKFAFNSRKLIGIVARCIDNFKSKDDFFSAIESKRYGGF